MNSENEKLKNRIKDLKRRLEVIENWKLVIDQRLVNVPIYRRKDDYRRD